MTPKGNRTNHPPRTGWSLNKPNPKRTKTLLIRIAPDVKAALMAQAAEQGKSAADMIENWILKEGTKWNTP